MWIFHSNMWQLRYVCLCAYILVGNVHGADISRLTTVTGDFFSDSTPVAHTVTELPSTTDHITRHDKDTLHYDRDHDLNDTHYGNNTHDNHTEHHEHEERYHVASMDFERVSIPLIVSVWLVFAVIAKTAFHMYPQISKNFPESCLLIIIGLILGVILYFAKVQGYSMDSHLFFFYLLPPIILEAGYFMPVRSFFDNIGSILMYAVVGTLFNTFLVGFCIYGFSLSGGVGWIPFELPLLQCLVFAALLAAVDPVAVLAVFEEIHVNEVLHIVVFGESLLNDGVTVVLYHLFEEFEEIGESNIIAQDIILGVVSFLLVAVVSTLMGFLFGFLTALLTRFTVNLRVIEPLCVFSMGYLSYLTAEMFHMSGILSCTFCGISMRKYVERNISHKSHTTIKYFMKMLAATTETIIFMFLGLSTVVDTHHWDTAFVLLTLLFCLAFRCIGTVLLTAIVNSGRLVKLTKVDQFVMAYGGLRGAIAFSLVVILDEKQFPQKNLFITTTLVVVYFTNMVLGTTIKPLVEKLHVKKAEKIKPSLTEQINNKLIDHMLAGVEDITGFHGHHELRLRWQWFDNKFLKPLLIKEKRLRASGQSILDVNNKLEDRDASMLFDSAKNESYANLLTVASIVRRRSMGSNMDSLSGAEGIWFGLNPNTPSVKVEDADGDGPVRDPAINRKGSAVFHQILDEHMLTTRKRFHAHQRGMLTEHAMEKPQPINHHKRLHLRTALTAHRRHHRHGHHGHHGGHHGHHKGVVNGGGGGGDSRVELLEAEVHNKNSSNNGRQKNAPNVSKSVSFENAGYDAKEDEDPKENPEEDPASSSSSCSSSSSGSDSESDQHEDSPKEKVAFTLGEAELGTTNDETDELSADSAPVAAEMTLPWKSTSTNPARISASASHQIPDDMSDEPPDEPPDEPDNNPSMINNIPADDTVITVADDNDDNNLPPPPWPHKDNNTCTSSTQQNNPPSQLLLKSKSAPVFNNNPEDDELELVEAVVLPPPWPSRSSDGGGSSSVANPLSPTLIECLHIVSPAPTPQEQCCNIPPPWPCKAASEANLARMSSAPWSSSNSHHSIPEEDHQLPSSASMADDTTIPPPWPCKASVTSDSASLSHHHLKRGWSSSNSHHSIPTHDDHLVTSASIASPPPRPSSSNAATDNDSNLPDDTTSLPPWPSSTSETPGWGAPGAGAEEEFPEAEAVRSIDCSASLPPSNTYPQLLNNDNNGSHNAPPPWRTMLSAGDPVFQSPSAFPASATTLRPQLSYHHLSEAESRHSEPVHVPPMIDPALELGCHGGTIDLEVEHEQLPAETRVEQWILSNDFVVAGDDIVEEFPDDELVLHQHPGLKERASSHQQYHHQGPEVLPSSLSNERSTRGDARCNPQQKPISFTAKSCASILQQSTAVNGKISREQKRQNGGDFIQLMEADVASKPDTYHEPIRDCVINMKEDSTHESTKL